MCDSEDSGSNRAVQSGNTVGPENHVGEFNHVSGGVTVDTFIPNTLSRRPWLSGNAQFDDRLLDVSYPNIALQWTVEITLDTDIVFRLSDKAFYVQNADGVSEYYDARVENAPTINVSVGEWLNPNYQISDLTLQINNRDGFFNPYLSHGEFFKQWSNASVVIKVGFGEQYSNYVTLFEGNVTEKQGISTTRDSISLHVYDKLAKDAVPIPANAFVTSVYPDVNTADAGKPIPLVYGDWTTDVPACGAVTAYCINANEVGATAFEYKISDFELQSIDSIWLHRGNRKEGEPEGPIQINTGAVTRNLLNGSFSMAISSDVFTSEAVLYDNQTCGSGSSFEHIAVKDSSINFITQRIQVGDRVLKRATGQYATVTVVANTALTLTGSGVTFANGDEYVVLTSKYQFLSGDRVSITCNGKPLNILSTLNLLNLNDPITQPWGLSVDSDDTLWISDNSTQKIYHLTASGTLIQEIAYASINSFTTTVRGISVTPSGGFIWVVDSSTSTIYKYDYVNLALVTTLLASAITGLAALAVIFGIAAKANGNIWIVDRFGNDYYEVNPSTSAVVTTFANTAFDAASTAPDTIGYDAVNDELLIADRDSDKLYRVTATTGALVRATPFGNIVSGLLLCRGVSAASDGTLFLVDWDTQIVYNYLDVPSASDNPCYIARDLLQTFGNHTSDEFDLSWNETAAELATYKCRAVIKTSTNVIAYMNTILKQYNVVFHQRFNKFALFRLSFENFSTDGRDVKEKDIKIGTFSPTKELNQYFNTAIANYDQRDFQGKSLKSDTYVSAAGVAFIGKEVSKTLDLSNVYLRTDIDRLMPLYIRLSVPDPEFVNVTFGFRLILTQMQDFLNLTFDGFPNIDTEVKMSGRRFNNIPCMVRSISYNLGTMSVGMKLWSLGDTAFPGYTPPGRTVGGYQDVITLTNLGRLGRVSPIGTITGSGSYTLTLATVSGVNAQTRTGASSGLAWKPGHKVDRVNAATKAIIQTLTIASVSGSVVTFVEALTGSVTNSVANAAGFITSGEILQYSTYSNTTDLQKGSFASFCNPTSDYPATQALEVSAHRTGLHSFSDATAPYLLYPKDYTSI